MFHLHIISGLHQSRTCALLWVYALLLALFKVILEDHGLEVIEQSKVLVTANEKNHNSCICTSKERNQFDQTYTDKQS
jgi:hypothetical protein